MTALLVLQVHARLGVYIPNLCSVLGELRGDAAEFSLEMDEAV